MVLDGQEFVVYSVEELVELRAAVAGHIFDCILGLGIADCRSVADIAVRNVVLAVVAGKSVAHLHTLNLLQRHLLEEWC